MSKLRQLISTLTQQIKDSDPQLSSIKYPNKLLLALEKLNSAVGMNEIKNNIADQVVFLIMAAKNGEKKKYMLNTVFYGPPGVGKTKIGIVLAEIWCALGYIENKTTTCNKMINYEWDHMTLFIISLYLIYGLQILAYAYQKVGIFYFSVVLGAIVLLGLLFYVYWGADNYTSCSIEKDTEIIKIVSRKDFIAEYVGQTAIKTNKLLDTHRGKVLFIDEAYSLMNDSRDPFGLEALTTLNQFMSENPDEIVVIFAGYKDKMQSGIFNEQPGLPRRCMWHFECMGYSGAELYEIFKSQLAQEDWMLEKTDCHKIKSLIESKASFFPAYGGDTERLCFFAKLESTNEAYHEGKEIDHTLKESHISKGLKLLSNNNIHKDNNMNNVNPQEMNELMNMFNRVNKDTYRPPLNGDN